MKANSEVIPKRYHSPVDLKFRCEGLPDVDAFTKTDALLVIFMKNLQRENEWSKVGQTEVIQKCENPQFSKSFPINFFFEEKQLLKVEVYHKLPNPELRIGKQVSY